MASTVLKFFCSSSPESTASKEAIWAARWAAWTPDRPRGRWDGWEECEITESFWWFLELWYGIDLYLSTEVIFARGSLIVRSPQSFQMKLSLWNLWPAVPDTVRENVNSILSRYCSARTAYNKWKRFRANMLLHKVHQMKKVPCNWSSLPSPNVEIVPYWTKRKEE